MRKRPVLLNLIVLFFYLPSTRADVVNLSPVKDTTIFQNNVNNSLGGGQVMFAGTNGSTTPSPRRALLEFDIAGSVPAGSTIQSVQLTLYLAQVAGSGAGAGGGTSSASISLFRLSDDWGEGTAGNTSTGTIGVGNGFAAATGDATWNARLYSSTAPTPWTAAGGDFSDTASAALTSTDTTLNDPYVWTSTPALVADVQAWLRSPSSNFGWLLEINGQTFRAFWTREASRTSADSQFVPQLEVTYAVPEPGVGLMCCALAVLL